MAIKLYGMAAASCTQRVLAILIEKSIPYELITINILAGDQKKPDYLTKHPFGKTPVLEDDGILIYESRAIAKYLARKFTAQGPKLIPDEGDFVAYGLFEQACSVEMSYFDAPAHGLAAECIFKPKFLGIASNPAEIEKFTKTLDQALAVYETILSKQAYLAGNELTLADLAHLPYGNHITEVKGEVFAKYPAVHKWMSGLLARESWKQVLSLE